MYVYIYSFILCIYIYSCIYRYSSIICIIYIYICIHRYSVCFPATPVYTIHAYNMNTSLKGYGVYFCVS